MKVERLYRCATVGAPLEACATLDVRANAGVIGDRYFDCHDEPGQNITLVEAEAIEAFLEALGRPIDLAITRRNVVTRGVALNALVGREFCIGTVRLRGVELCEPCGGLGRALAGPEIEAAEVVRRLTHRAGLRADVLSDGRIEAGAAIHIGA